MLYFFWMWTIHKSCLIFSFWCNTFSRGGSSYETDKNFRVKWKRSQKGAILTDNLVYFIQTADLSNCQIVSFICCKIIQMSSWFTLRLFRKCSHLICYLCLRLVLCSEFSFIPLCGINEGEGGQRWIFISVLCFCIPPTYRWKIWACSQER